MRVRVSLSVISFGDKIEPIWGLKEWRGVDEETEELLFFGLYTGDDYDVYRMFQGERSVFWCGSDILNLLNNPDYQRILRLFPAKHYVENEVEAENLKTVGIEAKVIPSFLDNIDNYSITYQHSNKPEIFISGHTGREDEYGMETVRRIAHRVPETKFHVYGIDKDSAYFETSASARPISVDNLINVDTDYPNIYYHGKVPQGQFNNEISRYQCGLRVNEHDGNSEVTMKSILNGGYPITRIKYPNIWNYRTDDELVALIDKLKFMKEPNTEGRNYYINNLNKFPWIKK